MTDAPRDDDAAIAELFARQPERMVPDLSRITTLCELLGRPDQAMPAIQLTGTNGKTTTARMISSLLAALGLQAGAYTSPHLQDVRERIRVADEIISRDDLSLRLAELAPFLVEVDARHPEILSFFEVLTALAFVHFADVPVDVAVFEVGMGGRWDATNLARGEVALIGTVALDHPELGDTVDLVAGEKVGIIKDGAAVVSAGQVPEVAELVAEAARRHDSQLVVAGRDFRVADRALAVGGQVLTLEGVTGTVTDIVLPLHGAHQADNAAAALATVEAFFGFAGGLDPDIVREGFAAVRSPGRLEPIRRIGAPTVLLDGAHNPAGAASLATALRDEFGFRNRVLVLGALGDKDIEALVAALAPVTDHLVATTPPSRRAAPADRIVKAARAAGIGSVEVVDGIDAALDAATGLATDEDGVVVTGSMYTVGAARESLGLAVD